MARQKTFFDDMEPDNRPEWEQADRATIETVRVVFPDGPDGYFDYRVPDRLSGKVIPGIRLLVPLGKSNRSVTVYAIEVSLRTKSDESPSRYRLKDVSNVIDSKRILSDKMLDLARWISKRYLCPLGQVLEGVLPAGVRSNAGTRMTTVYTVTPEAIAKVTQIVAQSPDANHCPLTSKQLRVFEILKAAAEPMTLSELARAAKCSLAPITALKNLGLFRKMSIRRKSGIFEELAQPVERTQSLVLNSEQQVVLDRILQSLRGQEFRPFLLHGITGSGKTEVYIQAIEEVVGYGRQAIVLVPEISLTPQTVNRFRQRFDSVAVLHSHLTDSERHVEWTRIASGNVQVVIGARSAVFAPVPRLGLIIIDEEHENSFKQDSAPRYHAREVALYRAKQENIPVVLGSATPSLESWYRHTTGEFELLSIPHRVKNLPLPVVYTVDLRSKNVSGFTRGAVHQLLQQSIVETLEDNGQIILLLNRRGFSTQMQCPACGEVVKCPNCDVSLTHHYKEQIALCHYCDYQIPVPDRCPKCGATSLRFSGFGTQKLEQELTARFPEAKTLRMDADTMQGHGSHERALSAFRKGEFQILLGTQMIAKGLDFPNVTLVGVINADTALHLPDFRASERTFHLITQVAGRAGRSDRKGKVIVQTYDPENPAIIAATHHDFYMFVEQELEERRKWGYPPFTSMVRFVVRGPNEQMTLEFAKTIKEKLRESLTMVKETVKEKGIDFKGRILGPAAAPFSFLRGNFRYQIHLHGNDTDSLLMAVDQLRLAKLNPPADVQWIIDVDPLDML